MKVNDTKDMRDNLDLFTKRTRDIHNGDVGESVASMVGQIERDADTIQDLKHRLNDIQMELSKANRDLEAEEEKVISLTTKLIESRAVASTLSGIISRKIGK